MGELDAIDNVDGFEESDINTKPLNTVVVRISLLPRQFPSAMSSPFALLVAIVDIIDIVDIINFVDVRFFNFKLMASNPYYNTVQYEMRSRLIRNTPPSNPH